MLTENPTNPKVVLKANETNKQKHIKVYFNMQDFSYLPELMNVRHEFLMKNVLDFTTEVKGR